MEKRPVPHAPGRVPDAGGSGSGRRFRRLTGWGAALFLSGIGVLMGPLCLPAHTRLIRELVNLMHVPLGMILAAFLFAAVRGGLRRRALVAVGASALLLGAVEVLQGTLGRERAPGDWLLGMAGVLLAGLACAMRRTAEKPRWSLVAAWVLVCAAALYPSLYALNDQFAREKAFPVLTSFERASEAGRWTLNGVTLTRVNRPGPAGHASWAGRVCFTNADMEYPGLFLTELEGHWMDAEALSLDAYWSGASGAQLEFRLDDLPGNPPYAERVQTSLPLEPGWNALMIPLSDLQNTPSGRRLQFDKVRQFGFFFFRASTNEYLVLDNIRLLLR